MKTTRTDVDPKDFLSSVKNERRRRDGETVMKMMRAVTRKRPRMWGPSIIGFDRHRYRYASGREGEICTLGFSPRSQALAFYVTTEFEGADQLLKKLGKHKFGNGGCLYINKLDDVDLDVLRTILEKAYQHRKQKEKQAS